ncbi:hypothetical protein [Bradyrhizobium sp. Ash2021]|uniref:hypothetical protein n=1 Tax=Bradyrhizobium sp. Ash2021 TaxID=2954771 RepID=UPI0028157F75|nr:hypothetical protein [Bradyrhizobium sp. Ash2021]WMT77456.1 hypothetical protein NL528_14350 [Bradyrhizobium sp. Ash2021]
MMESQSIKPAYQIRLLERFVFYAPDRGVHLWREWPEGATVTDADAIELLTKLGAPVEVVRD